MWGKVNSVMKSVAGEKLKILTFAQKNTNFVLVRAKSFLKFLWQKKFEHEDMIFMKT